MAKRVLIAYASYAGSTAEVAGAIGEALAVDGTAVDVVPVGDVTDLAGYGAVVLGSPIHSGEWLPEAVAFAKAHRAALGARPLAAFTLALRLRDGTGETRQSVEAILRRTLAPLKPVSLGLFAGVMDYGKLSAIKRLQVQSKRLPEGDFRDWDAIRAWAAELSRALLSEALTP